MVCSVVNQFNLSLNLSIASFAIGIVLGVTEFFEAYLHWLNLSVIMLSNLIALFVTLYIFSSIFVGVRDFLVRNGLPVFILVTVITFIGMSFFFAYFLVIGLVYAFDFIGTDLLRTLTPSMLDQMAAASNTALSLNDSNALKVVYSFSNDTSILSRIFTPQDYADTGLIGVGVFLIFSVGLVSYALRSEDFSLPDCIEEIYCSSDAAFKGLIRILPLLAFPVGMAATLNVRVNFNVESLLTWIGVLLASIIAISVTLAVFISLLSKRPVVEIVGGLLRLSLGSLGAPSIFLMFPLIRHTLERRLGIASCRVQILLPSTLLLCNMAVVLSCVLLLALTMKFSSSAGRSLVDLVSPAIILFELIAIPVSHDLLEVLTQFSKRVAAIFGFSSGMYVPLTAALLPVLIILARPLSILFVMVVAVVVAKLSGDDMELEDHDVVVVDKRLFVIDMSPIVLSGILTFTFLSILIMLAVGYSVAMTGIFVWN